MIEAHGVVKSYGKLRALNGFELSARKNTVHALVGPNGSGKSTVIKILAGEVKPDSGIVTVNGIPVSNTREVQRQVSQIPDICSIPDSQTPRKMLWKHGKVSRIHKEEITYRVDVLSEMLGLTSVLDTRIGELSRGMKRRITLGMGLITDASIILMDGSLAELDPLFCMKFVNDLRAAGDKTILITANNMDLLDKICDGVTIIKDGATLMNESMTSVREKIGRPAITLRTSQMNLPRLVQSINKQLFINRTYVGSDYVTVEVDDIIHIPMVIRQASAMTEVYEARQSMTSLEDLYRSFFEQQ
ncbi:ATP-binding cassette domain-containing protein [Methanocella sp. MCL-LM]|uniref:ABC transporter ATP-binding protein n=1 Tax=Methanocella sp. MCL-LM TaxID=3412035 RepID=UPI003C77C461